MKKVFRFIVLLFLLSFTMGNLVYSFTLLGEHNKQGTPKKVKPVLPKPITFKQPDGLSWEGLNEGFLLQPGKSSISFPLDRTRTVDEVKVYWTSFNKKAKGYLYFNNEKVPTCEPFEVGNYTVENWFPCRRAKSFKIKAEGNPVRLLFVKVVYHKRTDTYESEEGEATPPVGKYQIFDYIGIPISIKANSAHTFKLNKPYPVKEITILWEGKGGEVAEGYLLYDKEKPSPEKKKMLKGYGEDRWKPKQKIKNLRVFAKEGTVVVHQITVVYE